MKKIKLISFILIVAYTLINLASCGIFSPINKNKDKSVFNDFDSSQIAGNSYTTDQIPALIEQISLGEGITIESVSAIYVSAEYYEELVFNSIDNYFFNYSSSDLDALSNEAWFFGYNEEINDYDVQIIDRASALSDYESSLIPEKQNNTLRNLLIGGGVILVCVALSVFGSPAIGCVALAAAKGAVAGALIGSAVYATGTAIAYRASEGTWEGAGEEIIESASEGWMIGAISGMISGALSASNCFVAGTPILTTLGFVAIESISVGDEIICSYPNRPYETTTSVVKDTFSRFTHQTYLISLGDERLETTAEHPFYVKEKGFVPVEDISAGDFAVNDKGDFVEITNVEVIEHSSPVEVFNFEVENVHTYFVGENEPVLVHNSCLHTQNAWAKERASHWKQSGQFYQQNYATYKSQLSASGKYIVNEANIQRMLSGKAPLDAMGKTVQLHHTSGIANDMYSYIEITNAEHYANFKELHWWLFK